QVERCRWICWIALHQKAVEPLGFGNVSDLFSRLGARKQIIGIVPTVIDREHVLAAPVGTPASLFDFEAIAGTGTKPHTAKPNVGQPFSHLLYAANAFSTSNAIFHELRHLPC